MRLLPRLLIGMAFSPIFCFPQEIRAKLNREVRTNISISYLLDYPEESVEKVPLIVFLHGAGERGADLNLVKMHGPFSYKNLIAEPVAILAPQCPANEWWDTFAIYQLVLEIKKKYKIDENRIYLTGLSMGGWGTLKLAMEHPELFAAVAAVAAPTDRVMLANIHRYKDMNLKLFQGGLDDVVLPENAFKFYQKVHPINHNVELTIFPNDNHNSWDSTYSDPEFYRWMLSSTLKK